MKIGGVEIKGKVALGPMAGVTTLAYREFMKPFGVALSFSEMISDCGIDYGNEKTIVYTATSAVDRPVGLQLFGSSLEHSVRAIKYLEEHADYDILDVNLGCPVYKVTKTGAGSAMLKDPQRMFEYMKGICQASSKPVTAKIRLGWDENSINVWETVPLLEKTGVKAITIHCRTSRQGYAGKADYDAIEGIKKIMSVPLIVSGDIFTPEDAKKAVEITGADMVMVARGGVGHPYLISEINDYLEKGIYEKHDDLMSQVRCAETFSEMLIDQRGEIAIGHELRGLLPHFFSVFPGFKKIRNEIAMGLKTRSDLDRLFSGLKNRGAL